MGDVAHAWKTDPRVEGQSHELDKKAMAAWWKEIDVWRAKDSLKYKATRSDHAAIRFRLYELSKDKDVYITTEVGQHQMWAAQFFKFEDPHHWMTSGGLGTMGYGLPAAVGVQIAHPKALVVDIAGDASVQMTMQEMSTAVQYRLPIKIFILNNQYMAWCAVANCSTQPLRTYRAAGFRKCGAWLRWPGPRTRRVGRQDQGDDQDAPSRAV